MKVGIEIAWLEIAHITVLGSGVRTLEDSAADDSSAHRVSEAGMLLCAYSEIPMRLSMHQTRKVDVKG